MGIPWANVEEEDVCGRVSERLVDGAAHLVVFQSESTGRRPLSSLLSALWQVIASGGSVEAGNIECDDVDDLSFAVRPAILEENDAGALGGRVVCVAARREVGEDGLTTLTLDVAAEDLVDLLRAYDAYIQAAFDARLPDSGWCPVCVDEFAENEYRNVWLCREEGEDPFAYMFGDPGGE